MRVVKYVKSYGIKKEKFDNIWWSHCLSKNLIRFEFNCIKKEEFDKISVIIYEKSNCIQKKKIW